MTIQRHVPWNVSGRGALQMFRLAWTALAMGLVACAPTQADLGALIKEAMACQPGDTCVLAGASPCSCDVPVNATRAAEVDDMASHLYCGGKAVVCTGQGTPTCENGQCTRRP